MFLYIVLLTTACDTSIYLQYYTVISGNVVGILLRARKRGFVDFPGETLFQVSSVSYIYDIRQTCPESIQKNRSSFMDGQHFIKRDKWK